MVRGFCTSTAGGILIWGNQNPAWPVLWASMVVQTVKKSACNAGDPGSISEPGRSPEEGNGCPLQYSCLENHMDRGAWWATTPGVPKNWARLGD